MGADTETAGDSSVPNSTAIPVNPLDPLLKEKRQGAQVHSFNPDVNPEEKAQQIKKDAPQPLAGLVPNNVSTKVVSDVELNPKATQVSQDNLPSISITDADEKETGQKKHQDVPVPVPESTTVRKSHNKGATSISTLASVKSEGTTTSTLVGDYSENKSPYEIPIWYKVGWTSLADESPEKNEKDVIADWLGDMWFGQFYHNAGIIIFAMLTTYVTAKLGGGLGWLFVIGAFCATYYQTSIRRVRMNSRDDINRELTKTRLESDDESVEWLNNFLSKFWIIYEPVLSASIVASVDAVLAASTPTFLDSLRLSTFTLGNKAPHVDRVKTYPNSDDDIVLMDWSFSFIPSDKQDLTAAQRRNRINPKIVLSIRLGKGFASASFPVLVEDIAFRGKMRVKLKLMNNFPHVQSVDLSFLERPFLDYVLKPIGGDTLGVDVANIPGLSGFIREMTHGTLGPMMYDPNVFTLNLEQMLSGASLDSAIGVLQVSIYNARGLKNIDITGTLDPYVKLSINQGAELARTETRSNTLNPQWNETKFLLLNNINEILTLEVIDFNDYRKDKTVGVANFDLKSLETDPEQEGIVAKVKSSGHDRGELRFDVNWFPVLSPKKLEDGSVQHPPETNSGIVRFTLHQAKDLDYRKSMIGQLSPYAEYLLNGKPVYKSKKMKRTNNPVWEESFEMFIADKNNCTLGVRILDDRDLSQDPCVGTYSIKLGDLLEKNANKHDTFSLANASQGRVKMSAIFKPVHITGDIGSGGYVPPIGVVRLLFKCARDVRNVEALSGGKSDPYVRVMVNNDLKARTVVVGNDLNPIWDEVLYVPVHSIKESLILEVMDYQSLTKDRSLGYTEVAVSTLAKLVDDLTTTPDAPVFTSNGKHDVEESLQSIDRKSAKGTLLYEATFCPCIPLKDTSDDDNTSPMMENMSPEHIDALNEAVELRKSDITFQSQLPASSHETANSAPKTNGTQTHGSPSSSPKSNPDVLKTNGLPSNEVQKEEEDNMAKEVMKEHVIELSREQLMQRQCGVLVIRILEGQLAKKDSYLEILVDDAYWPVYTTQRSRGIRAKWNEIGEAVIKELDFSRLIFRLKQHKETEKDDIIGELTVDTKYFVEQTLHSSSELKIPAKNENSTAFSMVKFSSRYIPIDMVLDPSESINNMGELRIDVLDGKDLPAADRSGTSDPYVIFTLNEQKVHRTKVVKKTCNPTFGEHFETQVPSRTGALFVCEVFDWNQIEENKRLGTGRIDLIELEPFTNKMVTVQLDDGKGKAAGSIRLRMVFRPQFITRARRGTSTFSSATRVMTGVATTPFAVGKGSVGVVKSGMKGGLNLFKRDKHEPTIDEKEGEESGGNEGSLNGNTNSTNAAMATGIPSAQDENGGSESTRTFPSQKSVNPETGGGAPGTITITVISAKDLHAVDSDGTSDPFVKISLGKKELEKTRVVKNTINPSFNESMHMPTHGGSTLLNFQVLHHKTLGRSVEIGNVDIDPWDYVGVNKQTTDTWIRLHGEHADEAELHLRLQYTPAGQVLPMATSRRHSRRVSETSAHVPFDRVNTQGSMSTVEKISPLSALRKKIGSG